MPKDHTYIIVITLICATIMTLLPALFLIIFTILYNKKQVEFYAKLAAIKTANEKELLKSQLEIQERTFEKISQEIHDNIGQEISIAKLYLNTLDKNDFSEAENKVHEASEMLTKVMDDIRNLARDLNSNAIKTLGLAEVIKNNLQHIEKSGKYITFLNVDGEPKYMDEKKEFVIFRIFQEAINNIIKHARATEINISLNYHPLELALMIADNGSGFDAVTLNENKYETTSGLLNMQRRARLIGANYCIDSSECNGTIIKLVIPYSNDNNCTC